MKMQIEVMRTSSRSRTFVVDGVDECECHEKAYDKAHDADYNQANEGLVEYEITMDEVI